MKKPQINRPQTPQGAEIPPTEGLTVTEVQNEAPPSQTVPEDPLPSAPITDEPVLQRPEPAVGEGMAYLGTFALDGMVSRGNNGRVAALPVVAFEGARVVGVLAVSDPGLVGETLETRLREAGYGASFEFRTAGQLDRLTKLAAAKSLIAQQDPSLDRVGAVMSLGFNPSALS